MQILDGKKLSEKILNDLSSEIRNLDIKPTLDIIIVGNDPSSQKYVEMKQQKAESIGIGGNIHQLDQNSTTEAVLALIDKLNQDNLVTSFMVQLPLP
ncbi:MAG: tetrahydrofolate dehydrogenase/cyclohydrolase catalytic domain-containing protein, partial [Candidatus Shapirobacteria bacterium]